MGKGFSVLAKDSKTEQQWIKEISTHQKMVGPAMGTEANSAHEEIHHLVLIDQQCDEWKDWVQKLNRTNCRVVLVVQENEALPTGAELRLVDDLMVYPFRSAELLSHYRLFKIFELQAELQKEVLEEVQQATSALSVANETMERILKSKTPKRFSGIKGISIMSRHLSGLKPGGDYFDVFESERKDFVNFLLADSSSYGLSSALLGMILSSSAKIASDANMNTSGWIKAIFEELKITLGEKEHLSIFFGRLNRRDFALHYQLYGSCEAYIVTQEGKTTRLEKHGARIHSEFTPAEQELVVSLNPRDRIILLSDGFVQGVGGETHLNKLFLAKDHQDPFALINELSYQIKSKLSPGETFPGEDCSAIVIDVENRVLRLAPTG